MATPATAGDQPFSAEQAWVFPFSAGVPGSGKDVPALVGLTTDPQSTTVEHRGGNQVISKGTTLDSVDVAIVVGRWALDAVSTLVGGTYTATVGTTPNQTRKLIHATTDQPADCAIQAQTRSKSPDGGGTRLTFYRCQPAGLPDYGFTDAEYQDLTINMSALPESVGNKIIAVEQFETYTALTATFAVA